MNKYDKKRKLILFSFITLCIFTLIYICLAPPSSLMSILVLVCFILGYLTFLYSRDMKKKSATLEKRKMTQKKKRRRQLLEREKGKVLEFTKEGKKE